VGVGGWGGALVTKESPHRWTESMHWRFLLQRAPEACHLQRYLLEEGLFY
jgi:hypothetical protein